MGLSPRTLRPANNFTPRSITGLALWLDASDSQTLYTTDAGAVTAVSAPTEISGCVLWLDGADSSAASMTLNGSLVETWKDKSGSNNNATASGTARPTLTSGGLNGKSVVTFDGTANAMQIAANAAFNSNDLTYFVVFKQAAAANKGVYTKLNATAGTNGFGLAVRSDPQIWLLQKNAGASQVLTSTANPTTQARIYTVTSSSTAAGYLDGLSSATGASTADHSLVQRVMVGSRDSSEYLNGYVAEVIHYNRVLTRSELAQVEAMLAAKWGISGVHAQATATSDPVGAWLDKSGNARHLLQPSSSPRPVVGTQGARRSLSLNGTSQWLRQERTNYRMRTQFLVWRRAGTPAGFSSPFGSNASIDATLGGSAYAASDAHSLTYSVSSTGSHYWSSNTAANRPSLVRYQGAAVDPTAFSTYGQGAFVAPDTGVVNVVYTDFPTASTGNKAFYAGVEPYNAARLYPAQLLEVLQYTESLTASQVRQVERYLAAKWGIALAPQVSNADAQDWINRVYANGGTVSSSTAAAVNTLCIDLENASLRDRFYRLNLFCGTGLNAALVPLYRGPSLGGTQYGNATDTNNAFTTTDYSEASGLGPQATSSTTKYLDTGFAGTSFGATRHVGVFIPAPGYTASNAHSYLGSSGAGAVNHIGMLIQDNGICAVDSAGGSYNGVSATYLLTAGHYVGNTPSGTFTLRRTWRNGVAIGSGGDATATATSSTMYVFAENRNGTASRRTANGMYGYHFGLDMTSAQAEALRSAFNTFATAIGRPNV